MRRSAWLVAAASAVLIALPALAVARDETNLRIGGVNLRLFDTTTFEQAVAADDLPIVMIAIDYDPLVRGHVPGPARPGTRDHHASVEAAVRR